MRNGAIQISVAGFLGIVASGHVIDAQAATNSIPPNYRQLVARHILENSDRRAIRAARISQPKELWVGLFAGCNQPAICVEVIRQTILTSDARDVWVFTFRDGQIATAGYSYANCGEFSPFNELLRQN
jgi:hypothetical protein